MGLFGFGGSKAPKAPTPAKQENLPSNVESLAKMGNRYYREEDYASAVLCYEKMLTLPPPGLKINYPDALENLADCCLQGKGCPQDAEKARAAHSLLVKTRFEVTVIADEVFRMVCSPYCTCPADYERIIRAGAEGIASCWYYSHINILFNFEVLRALIHLSESGMKNAVGKDEITAFLSAQEDRDGRFWAGWPTDWEMMSAEEMRPLISLDSYVQCHRYMRALKRGMDKDLTLAQENAKFNEIWAEEFPDTPDFQKNEERLVQQLKKKYCFMTAEELLDSLYADEAVWQAAHSAEAKAAEAAAEAARLAGEQRVARREKLYRDGLLLCSGLGDGDAGLAAMREAAELGHDRAALWLLKRAAHLGSAEAFCMLGDLAMQGTYGLAQDELAAYGYYLAAAGKGSGRASAVLSVFHREGLAGVEVDETLVDAFFAASVEWGYSPSCLTEAEKCMEQGEWDRAEALLAPVARKTGRDERDAALAAVAALADLYRRKGDVKTALEYAIQYADLDYAQEPEDQNWAQYRAAVLRGEPEALEKMYCFFCVYDGSTSPAKRSEGRITQGYVHGVGMAFRAAYCAALRSRAEAGDLEACTLLYIQLDHMGEVPEARKWAAKALAGKHPHMLYVAAYLDADKFDLDEDQVLSYLEMAARGSGMYAEWSKDLADRMKQELRAEWRKERQMERARQARLEAERQAAINEKVDELRGRMDLLERDIDLSLTGDGYTINERVIRGDVSAMDGVHHQILRDAVEEKLRKKLEE